MIWALSSVLQIAAALSALLLARRRADHRHVAVSLVVLSLANLIRAALSFTILARAGPYVGGARAAFHVEQALFLLWPAMIAWLAWSVLGISEAPSRGLRLRPWASWTLVVLACIVGYPELRGEQLRRVYLGAELLALLVAVAALLGWIRRGTWRTPSPAALVVGAVVVVELAMLAGGPWPRGLFGRAWETEQGALCVLYGVVIVIQIGAWRRARPEGP